MGIDLSSFVSSLTVPRLFALGDNHNIALHYLSNPSSARISAEY